MDAVMSYLTKENVVMVFDLVTKAVAICATIAALTPTPKDDNVVSAVRKAIDYIGMNFLNAKNGK